MDARSLLQVLFLALVLGAGYAQVNTRPFVPNPAGSESAFPGEPGSPVAAVNHFVEDPPLPLRVLDKPSCTAGSADPSAPCEQDPEYDKVRELVNQLLATTSDTGLSVFLNDSLSLPHSSNGFTPRFRFEDHGMSYSRACDFREEWIYPQRARTPKNYWVFVVNQEGARQPVQVEICYQRYNGKEEPCNIGIPNTGDVSTSCKQRFISRRMQVVGSNQIELEEVLMPSCCVCYIRRNTFDIASRRGGTNTAESQPVGVHPPGGSAIGFIRQPPQHVNHNIRSNGGFNYHNLFQNGGH